ncbi:MAG: hypothetical protein AAF489_11405 [Bacteroidota bacterium]
MDSLIQDIFNDQGWTAYLFVLTAIIGILRFKKFKSFPIRCFIIYFAYFAFNDFLSLAYGRRWSPNGYNSILYNISYIITFATLLYVFYVYIENKLFRYFIKLMTVLYVLLVGMDLWILKIDYFAGYQIWPYIVGGATIIVCTLFYFYETMNSEKLIALERQLIFWIAIGYFFYFLAKVPSVINKNIYVVDSNSQYLSTINNIMTTVLCISLIIGFIWSHPQDQS